MSTSNRVVDQGGLAAAGLAPARDTLGPSAGRNVPLAAEQRALHGIVWSLTLSRVVLLPVFVVAGMHAHAVALAGGDPVTLRWGLLLVLTIIVGSDMLDGWLARRYGLASEVGAVLDAAADKLVQLVLVGFFTFVSGPAFASLPVWFFGLVLGRDVVLGGGWLVLRGRPEPLRVVHRVHGRAAAAGVLFLLFWLTAGFGAESSLPMVLLVAALIWLSVAAYVANVWKGGHT